ncbi:MAG: FAD-binding oxidoreductase [Bauldia sp.]
MNAVPTSDLLQRFIAIVGGANAVAPPADLERYVTERRAAFVGASPLVLKPGTVDEVSAILRLANETRTAIVPQGGNTGLVGGAVPDASGAQIVLSMERLNAIRSVDPEGDSMIVEAGVTLTAAKAAALNAGRMFALSIAPADRCQIGGNISTNAGGTAVLTYGSTRDLVLGLEVVLANGDVLGGLRALRKDNSGYDLKQLFIGAEGTLGVITAAVLKLLPIPRGKAMAMVGLASPTEALALYQVGRRLARFGLTSCELIPRIALDFGLRHLPGAADPLDDPHPWYVLLEVSSGRSVADARADLDAILLEALASNVSRDARIAANDTEAEALWRLRYSISDVQRPEGVSLKHDVAVPINDVPAFIAAGTAEVLRIAPDARPVPFGHIGDGNIHFNVSQPEGGDPKAFRAAAPEITAAIHALVARLGGSIAAEHGIGQMKRSLMPSVRSPVELSLMRTLKTALDPNGILNPGKVL